MPKCKICGEKFTPKFSSFEKTCQEIDCKTQWAMTEVAKQKTAKEKKVKQDWNKEKLEMKEKLKTLSDWKADLQKEINAIVREIDNYYPCIATGSFEGKRNAGHYASIGSNATLRFHLENIWIQSEHSNSWKAGDTLRYQQGIINTFGKDYLDYMDSLRNIPPLKLSIEEIKEAIPKARSILKWLKLQSRKFTTEERIELRRKFNNDLNIYPKN